MSHVFLIAHTFEVRTDLGCLRRLDGEEVNLRPKTFLTLVYLVRHRHRLVTKDELSANLWTDTAVTDDAIVQCIVELRKALGDSAREPRFVKTLPKQGYRFLAEVEELAPAADAPPVTPPVPSVVVPAVAVPSPRASRVTPSRWWPLPTALAVAGAILVTLWIRSSQVGADAVLSPAPGKAGIAVMFLDNQSKTAEIDWMRQGLAEMLISGLSRSSHLNVLGRKQLQTLMARVGQDVDAELDLDTALAIARRANASYVVLGSFARLGEKTRIDVHVEDMSSRRIASETLTVDRPDEVLTQVDLLAWRLARHFNAGLEPPKTVPAAGLTTNLDAYRYYSLGLSKALGYQPKEAVELFQRALKLDPDFVLARARIGYVYAVTSPQLDLARPYLAEASRNSERLRDSDRLLIESWRAIAEADYPAAVAALQKLVALYPYEIEAYDRLARLLGGERQHAEAIAVIDQGLRIDPESPDLYNTLGGLYNDSGRSLEAIAARQRFVALAPSEPNSHDSLGLSYQAAGRYEEAEASYQRALDLKPDFEVARIHLANTYFQTGRYRAAIPLYERYAETASSAGDRSRGYHALAIAHARLRQWPRAERLAARADSEAAKLTANTLMRWAVPLVRLQRGLPLGPIANGPRHSNRGARHSDRLYRLLLAHQHLQAGRVADGLDQLRELLTANPLWWSIDPYEDALGLVLLDLGRTDEAIAEFQRLLRLNPRYPRAQYFLGLAYEQKGMPAEARQAWEAFLSVWSTADADGPEVTAARARLVRMTN